MTVSEETSTGKTSRFKEVVAMIMDDDDDEPPNARQ